VRLACFSIVLKSRTVSDVLPTLTGTHQTRSRATRTTAECIGLLTSRSSARRATNRIGSTRRARINRQSVVRLLGTGSKANVAAARPGWRYVHGSPKWLFVYPMALSVADVIERLSSLPRSARTRPFRLAVQNRPAAGALTMGRRNALGKASQ
jgi:hypothetical protein